jgi:hypothetical protein
MSLMSKEPMIHLKEVLITKLKETRKTVNFLNFNLPKSQLAKEVNVLRISATAFCLFHVQVDLLAS